MKVIIMKVIIMKVIIMKVIIMKVIIMKVIIMKVIIMKGIIGYIYMLPSKMMPKKNEKLGLATPISGSDQGAS